MAITRDEMLDLLSFAGAELVNGNSNHGPMVGEALFAMGRDNAVLPWVEAYRDRLLHRPVPSLPIPRSEWQEYLGQPNRLGDWIEFFTRELTQAPWQDVVREWVPQLVPAVMTVATHGLIRTGHAARSLAEGETPQRLDELAQGLGYWAARYYLLPGSPSPQNSGYLPREAVDRVDRLHGPDFDTAGSITEQIKGLEAYPDFVPVIDLADPAGNVSGFISNLTETFAGIYLANQNNMVAFVHTVTAPSALRMLVPYLAADDARQAARYAWQACAAVYSWYSMVSPPDTSTYQVPAEGHEELIDRAVAAGGAHSIKFTEACLLEYALNPNPVYLVAARDVTERVGPV